MRYKAYIECDTCGDYIGLIWGDEDILWTGKCMNCGDIVMFATKDEVIFTSKLHKLLKVA